MSYHPVLVHWLQETPPKRQALTSTSGAGDPNDSRTPPRRLHPCANDRSPSSAWPPQQRPHRRPRSPASFPPVRPERREESSEVERDRDLAGAGEVRRSAGTGSGETGFPAFETHGPSTPALYAAVQAWHTPARSIRHSRILGSLNLASTNLNLAETSLKQ